MHRILYSLLFIFWIAPSVQSQPAQAFPVAYVSDENEVAHTRSANILYAPNREESAFSKLAAAITAKQKAVQCLGRTKRQRQIMVYYFPGRSNSRALVIGGVHGTELASIEVAKTLVRQLAAGDTPYYNVLVIPSLFPDNAATAIEKGGEIGSVHNIGRYSQASAPDPNRQMPALGKPYDAEKNLDALGRPIEYENGLLLQLIQSYGPQRIVNIHAIRDTAQGGIYADPRTDATGYALEFASDSSLALQMASYIENRGGAALGNKVETCPSAIYYKDPPVALPGQWQPRSCHSMQVPGERGHGVSLGSWASTAVVDSANAAYNRQAMRLFTMEFPAYKRPQDYAPAQQPYYKNQVRLYAEAIQQVFLEKLFVEE